MTDTSPIPDLAARVDEAARLHESIEMLTATTPFEMPTAYAIQRASIARRLERGEALVGMKMGLTSRAKMEQVGVQEPIYGHLTDAMQLLNGGVLQMANFIHPRVEPEVAFVLARDLRGPVTAPQALEAVSGVCAALEVIDSRFTDFKFTLADVVADNASSSCFVLGDRLVDPRSIELGNLGMVLSLDGEVKAIGSSAAILEHPARSLATLANMLAEVDEQLYAGQIVLAGGATKAQFLEPGMQVELEVDGLGRVEFSVAAQED